MLLAPRGPSAAVPWGPVRAQITSPAGSWAALAGGRYGPQWSQYCVSIHDGWSLKSPFKPVVVPVPGLQCLAWPPPGFGCSWLRFSPPGRVCFFSCKRWAGEPSSRLNRCSSPNLLLEAAECRQRVLAGRSLPPLFLPRHPQLSDLQQKPRDLVRTAFLLRFCTDASSPHGDGRAQRCRAGGLRDLGELRDPDPRPLTTPVL